MHFNFFNYTNDRFVPHIDISKKMIGEIIEDDGMMIGNEAKWLFGSSGTCNILIFEVIEDIIAAMKKRGKAMFVTADGGFNTQDVISILLWNRDCVNNNAI